jgi:hypothetical protein
MVRSDRKIVELSKTLSNEDNTAIVAAIELLRQEKPFEGAISLLTAYYDSTDDETIRKSISGFMNDLKDQSVSSEVIAEIGKKWKNDTISMLVSSCWQSGLNYSEYSMPLARAFLKGDYITAIECLTVIEESVEDIPAAQKTEVTEFIKDNAFPVGNEKHILALELLAILKR